jgi:hypothetical protein
MERTVRFAHFNSLPFARAWECLPMVALLKMPFEQAVARDDERRMFPRKEYHNRVQGCRLDHTIQARQQPYLSLAMRDLSAGGLSATTHARLELGEEIAVFFPPEGAQGGWDVRGRVVRCEPAPLGFQIALAFDHTPMAA